MTKKLCKCMTHATTDLGMTLLTNHQEHCDKREPTRKALGDLVQDLVRAMEIWATDEDGVHSDAYDAYRRGKIFLLEPLEEEEPHE